MKKDIITVNLNGKEVELTVKEAEQLISDLKNKKNRIEEKKEANKYKKIASKSYKEIVDWCSQRAREAEMMDYMTNGGVSYEIIQLLSYLPSDIIRKLAKDDYIHAEYLDAANNVLESRGEEPIKTRSK